MVPRCSVLHLSYVYKLYLYPSICIVGDHWQPYSDLNFCDLYDKQGLSFLSHTVSSNDFTGIRPLDPNSDNASLSSNNITFFILHPAMKCVTGGLLLYPIQSFYLLSYAVCPLRTGLRSYNISGGGHLISLFSPSSSNIFGIGYSWLPYYPHFVFFGMRARSRRVQHLYTTFVLFRILLKIGPLTKTVRIGCSWSRQAYYSNEPHYQYQQQHIPCFLF